MRDWKVLIATFILIATCHVLSQNQPNTKTKKPVTTLNNELKQIQQQKSRLNKQITQTKKAVRAVRGDINAIDRDLGDLEERLEQTTNRLSKGKTEQQRLKIELGEATKSLALVKSKLQERLRWMYKYGDTSVITALQESKDLGDFASRQATLQRIAAYDKNLFSDYTELHRRITEKKKRQDNLVVEIAGLKQQQISEQGQLKDTRQEKAEYLGKLRNKQKELERLARELQAEENAIEAQLAAYFRSGSGSSKLKPFSGRLSKPISAPITSNFGSRMHPILKIRRLHAGIDFGARSGTPIRSAADGIVISTRYSRGYGNVVMIDHGGGISTLYAHCSKIYVRSGQKVTRGSTIAAVGSTGLSTGPHLHFEVRVKGKAVNPASWF